MTKQEILNSMEIITKARNELLEKVYALAEDRRANEAYLLHPAIDALQAKFTDLYEMYSEAA